MHVYTCLLAAIYCKFQMSTLMLRRSSSVGEAWRTIAASVIYLELRRLKLKYTWQLTPDSRLPTGSTKFNRDGGWAVASGKGHAQATLINIRNSAHDFSVGITSCIYSHIDNSCPGCWLMWYLDIYLCMTNPALCDGKLVSQCAACSGSLRDDKSSH